MWVLMHKCDSLKSKCHPSTLCFFYLSFTLRDLNSTAMKLRKPIASPLVDEPTELFLWCASKKVSSLCSMCCLCLSKNAWMIYRCSFLPCVSFFIILLLMPFKECQNCTMEAISLRPTHVAYNYKRVSPYLVYHFLVIHVTCIYLVLHVKH